MRLKNLLPIALIFLFACTGNKFDYSNAYKFKVKNHSYTKAEVKNSPDAVLVQDNTQTIQLDSDSKLIASNDMSIQLNASENVNVEQVLPAEKSKKQEKLERRFEKIKKRIDKRIEKKSAKKTIAINSKIYIGGVIFLGGLVLIILGGVLGTIGSLAALVGVILVVWGLLEQA